MSVVCGMLHIGLISSYSNTNSITKHNLTFHVACSSGTLTLYSQDDITAHGKLRFLQVLVAEEYPECSR